MDPHYGVLWKYWGGIKRCWRRPAAIRYAACLAWRIFGAYEALAPGAAYVEYNPDPRWRGLNGFTIFLKGFYKGRQNKTIIIITRDLGKGLWKKRFRNYLEFDQILLFLHIWELQLYLSFDGCGPATLGNNGRNSQKEWRRIGGRMVYHEHQIKDYT